MRQSAVTAYPAFLDLVKRQLRRDYRDEDLSSAGLRIFTTLRSDIQVKTEQALAGKLNVLERGYRLPAGRLQGAVIVTDVNSAEVVAVVGDKAFAPNRLTTQRRQLTRNQASCHWNNFNR